MTPLVELRHVAGLALLGLLVPLFALYVLKPKRDERVVSSTWLWAAAARDLMAHSPWRRLVTGLSLVLESLALIGLAVAWARPAARTGGLSGDHLAIIVDTSASMSAISSEGVPRFELARRRAERLLDTLPPGGEAMLIEAAAGAVVVAPLDRDRRRLRAALGRLRTREVEGHLGRALSLASERLRPLPGTSRIAVLTDGSDSEPLRSDVPITLFAVGSPVDNTGLVRVDARRGINPVTRRDQVQVFGLVAHFGGLPRDVFVTLRQKNVDQPLDSRRIHLEPAARAPVVLTFEPTPADLGTGLVLELSPPDRMPLDDRVFARVPPGRKLPVVFAPRNGNPWVQRALQADPDIELLGTSLAELGTADVPDDALVVVDGACPERAPGADLVLLDPPPGRCRTAVVGAAVGPLRVTSWATSDPRLRFVGLDGVEVNHARDLQPEGPREALVRAGDTTLVADVSLPESPATLIGFEVGESNWPLKASFVLFIRNLAEQARERRARGITGLARTGEPLRLRVPVGSGKVEVETPSGETFTAEPREGLLVLPALRQAGFYHASWQGRRPGSVLVAANLVSSSESDTRLHPPAVQPIRPEPMAAREGPAYTEWGWLLAGLALLCLLLDAWWLTRRAEPPPLARLLVRSRAR